MQGQEILVFIYKMGSLKVEICWMVSGHCRQSMCFSVDCPANQFEGIQPPWVHVCELWTCAV